MKPTIVLAHGAFAESSSFDNVIDPLLAAEHRVFAWPNPLRSLAGDAAGLTDLVRSLDGPVVLVAHSYGGSVVTNVDAEAGDIVALVYIAGFALEPGESSAQASALAPGSTLADTLERVPLSNGDVNLRIAQNRYHEQFAADVPAEQAARMAVTQRPITEAAITEASGETSLWQTVPSWFLFGELDHNIPVGAHRIMADRAQARRTVEIEGAAHAITVSRGAEVAELVLEATGAAVAA